MESFEELKEDFEIIIKGLEDDRALVGTKSNGRNIQNGKSNPIFLVLAIICTILSVISIVSLASDSGNFNADLIDLYAYLWYFSIALWIVFVVDRQKSRKKAILVDDNRARSSRNLKSSSKLIYDELLKPVIQMAFPNARFKYRIKSMQNGYFEQYKTIALIKAKFQIKDPIFHLTDTVNYRPIELSICRGLNPRTHQLFIAAPYPQQITAYTYVVTKELPIAEDLIKGTLPLEDEEVSNETFNDYFEIHSTNLLHAYEVLTTPMVDLLIQIRQEYKKNMLVAFDGTSVQLAMNYNRSRFCTASAEESLMNRFKEFYEGTCETRSLLGAFSSTQ